MKKNLLTLFCALMALSATAQLAVPFDYTKTNFDDGTVTVQKGTKGKISWDGGVKHTQGSMGFNWSDSYVVIAIDGMPDKLTFSTSTSGASTPQSLGNYWYVSQSTSTTFSNKVWTSNKQTNTPTISLSQDTKYIKLCFSGNLEGYMKNISVSKYTPVATAATAVTANSFTANWNAATGTNITYTLEVSDANGVIKTVENLTETSYEVSNLDPESTYSYVIYVTVGETTSEASNIIEVTTLEKPAITPDQDEYTLISDTDIEGYTSIIITAVNVTEATATVEGDSEFYFKDADGNPVTTKTLAIEAEGPTEFELFSYFTEDGNFSATVTFSATDADDAVVTVSATASKPTNVQESKALEIVKSFNNGLLEFNEDYASIAVSTLIGKIVATGQGHTIELAKGQAYIVETIDFEGKKNTIKVK